MAADGPDSSAERRAPVRRGPVRALVRLVVGSLLAVLSLPLISMPSLGREDLAICDVMADSITRLYMAYFDRAPDQEGLNYWVGSYQRGEFSLEAIAEAFAQSPEFAENGLAADSDFVTWAYLTIVGRAPAGEELASWTQSLDAGYQRGAMMVTLTESSDFVRVTSTSLPLAGYLRAYPEGSHWYCGVGSQTLPTLPLQGELHADLYMRNNGDLTDTIRFATEDAIGHEHIAMYEAILEPSWTVYDWGGSFSGSGDYGRFLTVDASAATEWLVVFYPESIGSGRFGWQLVPPREGAG